MLGAIVAIWLLNRPTALTSLAPADLLRAHALDASHYRDLRRNLERTIALLEGEEGIFNATHPRVLTPSEEQLVLDVWTSYIETAFALDQIRRFYEDYYRFGLSGREKDRHIRSYLLTFASELALYDATARLIDLLERNPHVVRFLNVARPEKGIRRDSVAFVREELAGITDLTRVLAGKQYLSYLTKLADANHHAVAGNYRWLWIEVEQLLVSIEKRRKREIAMLSVAADFAPIKRRLKHLTFPVQAQVAEWMGDFRVKRAGKYLIRPDHTNEMAAELVPGDVMLSRKNWYLSNIGLPGFWPHAALYVGSNEDLATTYDNDGDVLDWIESETGRKTTFSRYLAESFPLAWRERSLSETDAESLVVIEAVSEGVSQSSLYHAAGDHLAVLRPQLPLWVKARAIARAFEYLDRPYDFDFDFATDNTLVCTEVVWRSYRPMNQEPGLDLEPIRVAGRPTLPANEIARAFKVEYGTSDEQFDFVFYLEGRERSADAVLADVHTFMKTVDLSKWEIQ